MKRLIFILTILLIKCECPEPYPSKENKIEWTYDLIQNPYVNQFNIYGIKVSKDTIYHNKDSVIVKIVVFSL